MKRTAALPEVPTLIESGYRNCVSTSWIGLLATVGTPTDVIAKLNGQINQGLKSPELNGPLARISSTPLGGTPADFTELMKADLARWTPVVKSLNLKTN